jgi:DNA-binding transcriptional LysR family regulator
MGFAALDDRSVDAVITLLPKPFERDLTQHLQAEFLFNDRIGLAAAKDSPWGRRRNIAAADLINAHLISPPPDTDGGSALVQAFRAAGLSAPSVTVTSFSVHLRNLVSLRRRFVAVIPVSILKFNPDVYRLKELTIDLPAPPIPVLIVTLKNRTLSPSVGQFLGCIREVAKTMQSRIGPNTGK